MKTYKLRLPHFIDPRWMNRVRASGHDTVVKDGKIEVMGQTMKFKEEAPAEGTAVRFWLFGSAQCSTIADIEYAEREKQERIEEEKSEARIKDF